MCDSAEAFRIGVVVGFALGFCMGGCLCVVSYLLWVRK